MYLILTALKQKLWTLLYPPSVQLDGCDLVLFLQVKMNHTGQTKMKVSHLKPVFILMMN
jgi:hypothetical protein